MYLSVDLSGIYRGKIAVPPFGWPQLLVIGIKHVVDKRNIETRMCMH